jgi:hypothetical protein
MNAVTMWRTTLLVLVAAACYSPSESDLYFLNATPRQIGFVFGDAEGVASLEPGARVPVPDYWGSMIYVESGIPATDPLHFLVPLEPGDPDDGVLLVLAGSSLHVVAASRWPSGTPTEDEVRRVATRSLPPLD